MRRLRQWVRRRPTTAAVIALSAALVAVLTGAAWLYVGELRGRYEDLLTRADQARAEGRYDETNALLARCPWLVRDARCEELGRRAEKERLTGELRAALQAGDLDKAHDVLERFGPELRDDEWKETRRALRPPVRILPLGARWNAGVAFSPDGRRLAVFDGATSAGIRLFETSGWQAGPDISVNPGVRKHENGVSIWQNEAPLAVAGVALSPDGRRLAALTCPGHGADFALWKIRIWDTTGCREVGSIKQFGVRRLAFSADGGEVLGYLGDRYEEVMVWVATSGKELRRFPATYAPFPAWYQRGNLVREALAFSADGRQFARGGRIIFSNETLAIPGKPKPPRDESFSLATRFWDTATGKELPRPADARLTPSSSFVFTPDLRLLAGYGSTTDGDFSLRVWDTTTGDELCKLQAPWWFDGNAGRLAFSVDGHYLAAATREDQPPEVVVWDVTNGQVAVRLRSFQDRITGVQQLDFGHWGPFAGLAWHPDGRLLAVSTEREIRVFDVAALAADE